MQLHNNSPCCISCCQRKPWFILILTILIETCLQIILSVLIAACFTTGQTETTLLLSVILFGCISTDDNPMEQTNNDSYDELFACSE